MTGINNNDYIVDFKLRLDWSEMDMFGHINNVMYFKYMQSARVRAWEQSGFKGRTMAQGIGPILASAECQFKIPLVYPGHIRIKTKVDFVKTTSFGFIHHIFNEKEELAAIGKDIVVTYDFNKNEKIPVPDWLRKKLGHP